MEWSELDDGSVSIKVKSKRGTGTRDEDEVTVKAMFSSIEEAQKKSPRLNQIVKKRINDARELENPPEEHQNEESPDGLEDSSHSKVYLGEGSDLSGWVPVPREVIFKQIVPIVRNNKVDDDSSAIKVNFSEDIPISGWNNVDENVVLNEIEPIVYKNKLDV